MEVACGDIWTSLKVFGKLRVKGNEMWNILKYGMSRKQSTSLGWFCRSGLEENVVDWKGPYVQPKDRLREPKKSIVFLICFKSLNNF